MRLLRSGAVESARNAWSAHSMKTLYAVRAIPVRDTHGAVIGWVRVDLLGDGTKPTDLVFLRDGSAWGQAQAAERVAFDQRLLYGSRDEAVADGLARLRDADKGIAARAGERGRACQTSGRLPARIGRRDLREHRPKASLVTWIESREERLLGGRGRSQAIGEDSAATLGHGHDVAASAQMISKTDDHRGIR